MMGFKITFVSRARRAYHKLRVQRRLGNNETKEDGVTLPPGLRYHRRSPSGAWLAPRCGRWQESL